MHAHFLLTGGTGMIGSDLVPRLLQAYQDATVTLLLRAATPEEATGRLRAIALRLGRDQGILAGEARVQGVFGDVTRDHLGLSPGETDRLCHSVTHIIHGAATIRFDHPLDEARTINCGGTRRMLEFALQCARSGRLRRFVYIGTSSVSGRRSGRIYEHELEMGQAFFNTYEQSKCESERLVRDHARHLPVVIVRPSIVIGDSQTGRTSAFNVVYIPLRLLARGLLRFLPGFPETTVDLVPVDWVNRAILYIMEREEAPGKVFHITAGPDRAARLGDLIRGAAEYFDRTLPLPHPRSVEFLPPDECAARLAGLPPREQELMAQANTLLPYITVDRLFDSTNTDLLLRESGIRFPLLREYAERIYAYGVATRWGKVKEG